jgi:hypothetical protein
LALVLMQFPLVLSSSRLDYCWLHKLSCVLYNRPAHIVLSRRVQHGLFQPPAPTKVGDFQTPNPPPLPAPRTLWRQLRPRQGPKGAALQAPRCKTKFRMYNQNNLYNAKTNVLLNHVSDTIACLSAPNPRRYNSCLNKQASSTSTLS